MSPELNLDGWTVEQKLALIDKIWDSMPEFQSPPIPEWQRDVIEKRLAARQANPDAVSPLEDVISRIRSGR